jgi:hypothetical protein
VATLRSSPNLFHHEETDRDADTRLIQDHLGHKNIQHTVAIEFLAGVTFSKIKDGSEQLIDSAKELQSEILIVWQGFHATQNGSPRSRRRVGYFRLYCCETLSLRQRRNKRRACLCR